MPRIQTTLSQLCELAIQMRTMHHFRNRPLPGPSAGNTIRELHAGDCSEERWSAPRTEPLHFFVLYSTTRSIQTLRCGMGLILITRNQRSSLPMSRAAKNVRSKGVKRRIFLRNFAREPHRDLRDFLLLAISTAARRGTVLANAVGSSRLAAAACGSVSEPKREKVVQSPMWCH